MRAAMIVVAVAIAAQACGPSTGEVRKAQLTLYRADPHQLLQLAMDVAGESYQVGHVDAAANSFSTVPRFYGPDGDLESAGAENFTMYRPNSVRVGFIVRLVATDDHRFAFEVLPVTLQTIPGSPKPRELGPDDPYLPGWVHGRVDALAYAIFDRAKPFAIAAGP